MDDSFYGNRHREDYGLFSEDDEDTPTSLPLRHSRKSLSGNSYSVTQRPVKSKNDNRPRNVIIGKEGYSPSRQYRHDDSDRRSPRQNQDGVYLGDEIETSVGEEEGSGGLRGGARSNGAGWFGFVVMLARLDLWKLVLLAGAVGVVFGAVYRGDLGSKFSAGFSGTDNLLPCDSTQSELPCLTSTEQQAALQLVAVAIPYLHKIAGQHECGLKSVASPGVSVGGLRRALPEFDSVSATSLQHFIYLLLANPDWNIEWQDKTGSELTDGLRNPLDSDLLLSRAPSLTLKCHIRRTLTFCWSVLRWLLLVVVGVSLLVGVAVYYRKRRREDEELMYAIVKKITSILMKHAENIKRKPELLPYVAIVHIRDLLITPSERNRKLAVWNKACDYMAKNESRVRVEQQQIAGEEFDVWRWISLELAVSTEEPITARDSGNKPSSANKRVEQGVSSRGKNWYDGTTFDDGSGRNDLFNSPYGSPSPCVRLKNMFEYVKNMTQEQVTELEDSVLDRCAPHGGVVHISVDKRHTCGCVYLKMDSLKSAGGAYQALHGGWYKGRLVTAKYVPPARYHKWFPKATSATVHLQPSC